MSDEHIDNIFSMLNMESKDWMSYKEFIASTLSEENYLNKLDSVFKEFDKQKKGKL